MELFKKGIAAAMAASLMLSGCAMEKSEDHVFTVTMVTDTGGINDQSFNQSSWEGLEALRDSTGAEVRYIESKQASDFTTNLDRATDGYADMVWGIGFSLADSILTIAAYNPDINFAIVDSSFEDTPQNVTGVLFDAQESSFLVGYIAGMTTETNIVGFVGGMQSVVIDQFEYGYLAGVAYAAAQRGVDIQVMDQYVESFSDAAKGKAIANKMYSSGADVVYHAAGGAGYGVIESAKENNKWVIGVDSDQAYLAPDNVLTSALKNVNVAVETLSEMAMNGEDIGGQTFVYGLADGGVGIPEDNPNIPDELYQEVLELEQKIIDGQIVPPQTKAEYEEFLKTLK